MKDNYEITNDNKPERRGRSFGGPAGGGHGPGFPAQGKPKNFKKSIAELLRYSKKYLVFFAVSIILSLAGTAFTLVGPTKLSEITDLISAGLFGDIDYSAIVSAATLLAVLYGLNALFTYAQGFIMTTLTQKIAYGLRRDISVKINRLPLAYFDSTPYGDVLSRVTNDVDTLSQSFNQSIVTLIPSLALLIGVIIMMFISSPILASVSIASSVLGFVLMSVLIKSSQKYFVIQQKELGAINGHIEETYAGHNIVRAYNGRRGAEAEFDAINGRLYKSAWKSQFISGLMPPIMGFVGNVGFVAVCVVGGALAFQNKITIGTIVAFMVYVRLFSQPLNQLSQAATSLQSAAAASERVFEFLGQTEMSDETAKRVVLDNVKGDVEFRNIKFSYTPEREIIHGFSVKAQAGQKIAIVGPTGAGKTTIVNLLMRFYELDSGEILIDGIPIKELTRENVHKLFGMVLQDTWLFEGTLKENVIYSKKGVSDEEVVAACETVGIDHFIRTLPNGYDTVLNDNANLSAGQKQLLTIARAMVENAPLLILDEATSSVDTRTEAAIQTAMDKLSNGRTSFVIAHRLSTIRNADLILVLKEGDIIEAGKHEELLAKNGFYAELYNSQFEDMAV